MTTRHHAFQYRLVLAYLLILLLGIVSDAFADATGRAGRAGVTAGRDCTGCHAAGAAVPTVTLNGSASVAAGSTNSYSVTITGGPAVTAGVDIAASAGTLIVSDATTKLLRNEIVHSAPLPMTGATATFTFDWQAPATGAAATLYVGGLSTNGANDDVADGTATTSLSIAIGAGNIQPPTTPSVPPPTQPAALTAVITAPATGIEGTPITFDATGSAPNPGSTISAYDWDFGDGNVASGITVTNTFVAGSYTVTLTVTDTTGAAISASQAITIDVAATPPPGGGDVTPEQALYDTNCLSCHGPAGTGGDAKAIVGTTVDEVMAAIETVPDMLSLNTLDEDDIEAIVSYLQPAAVAADSLVQTRSSVNSRGLHHVERRVISSNTNVGVNTKQQPRIDRGGLDATFLILTSLIAFLGWRRVSNKRS